MRHRKKRKKRDKPREGWAQGWAHLAAIFFLAIKTPMACRRAVMARLRNFYREDYALFGAHHIRFPYL